MLRTENLSKNFDNKPALKELNLSIQKGEIFCLLGANGAGKTTTINLLLGFYKPTAGKAFVNGREVERHTQLIRNDLAYVPEQVNLYPTLTGLENLTFFTRLAGKKVRRPDSLRVFFDSVGLDQKTVENRVKDYSKGMRQKVGLAIALAKDAKALLLDEPLSGLDPKAANEFCQLLGGLSDNGVAVLMATHDLFRAKEVGSRIGIMKGGRLIEDLSAHNLNHNQLEQVYLHHMRDFGSAHGALS